MLLALAGKARVGKDTIGRFLVSEFGFEHYYFAKPLKDMVSALGFLESEHQTSEAKERVIPHIGRSVRYLWQTLGTEWGREMVHPDLWLLLAARRWEQVKAAMTVDSFAPNGMVITDCRFDNEACWVRQAGGVVFHVQGSNELAGMSAQAGSHSSEAGVTFVQSGAGYIGDRIVFNYYEEPTEDSLRALYGNVAAIVNGLR